MNVEVVVFFIWVSLIIMPFIKKLDLFGIKVETNTDSLFLTSGNNQDIKDIENRLKKMENKEE